MTHNFEADHAIERGSRDTRTAARRVGAAAAGRAGAYDVDGGFPDADIDHLRAAGLLLAPFPEAMGGVSLGSDANDPTALLDVLVAVGQGSLTLGRLFEGHVNAVKLVTRYGSADNLALLHDEAVAGYPTGVWMAEDGVPLRLERGPDGTRLRGRKILASGAGHVRRPLVAAKVDEGSLMTIPFVADPARTDASGWTTLGMRATATGTVDFTGLSVGDDEIVGAPNDYMTSPLFRGGAWRVIATQLGGVEAILDHYRTQLSGVGDPLQLARFGEALIAAETARLWVTKACRIAEDPAIDPNVIDATVDLARNAFEGAALRVIALAQKAIGLRAFLRPNPLERIIRDLSTYMRQPALDASLTSAARFFLTDPARAVDDPAET